MTMIDGEEYEECSYEDILNSLNGDYKFLFFRKFKKKIEFPVRVELLDGSYCEIYEGKGIIIKYEDGSECGVISLLDLQKINEKMEEIEDAGGFGE